MPPATRVLLAPPAAWDEDALLRAARLYAPTGRPARVGDAVGELVVVGVEPEPGATVGPATEVEIAPAPPRPDAPEVDVLVLLDVSESMGLPWDADRTRLQAAREALAGFLARPSAAVGHVTLLEYAKHARIVAGPAPSTEVKLGDAPRPKGPSATADALDAALRAIAPRVAERAHAVLLLTDGVGQIPALEDAAARAGRLRVPVHSVAFAPEMDDALPRIASATGGSAQRARHPLTIEFEHEV